MLDMGQMTPSQVQSYNKRLNPKMRRWAEPQQDSRLENFTTDPIHIIWTKQYDIDCVRKYNSDKLPQAHFPYVAYETSRKGLSELYARTNVGPSRFEESELQTQTDIHAPEPVGPKFTPDNHKKSWSQNKVRRISKTGQWWTWPRQHFCQLRGQKLGIVIFMSHESWLIYGSIQNNHLIWSWNKCMK